MYLDFTLGDTIGVTMSAVGFGIAFWQIHRTRSAVEAARIASETAAINISRRVLTITSPDLVRIEQALDAALSRGDRQLSSERVVEWRQRASMIRGTLGTDPRADRGLQRLLSDSSQLATDAKMALDAGTDPAEATQALRRSMSRVNAAVQESTANLMREAEAHAK